LHFVQYAFTASLVFHSFDSSTYGATRDIIFQYFFTQTLVGLNKEGIEGEPLVTSPSNVIMGGAALASLLAADVAGGSAFSCSFA